MKIEQWREKDMNIGATRQLIRRAQPISRERRDGGGGGERESERYFLLYTVNMFLQRSGHSRYQTHNPVFMTSSLSPTLS
jgi:hypothetical protein